MLHPFKEVRILRQEGKLHKKLISRVRTLFIISLILLWIVVFNLIFRGVDVLLAGALAVIGFVLGLYVFSHMNVVNWSEQNKVVRTGRMDIVGYVALSLYITFEIGFRTFLRDFYPVSATAFLLAGIFGTIIGRAVGTVIEIHRVFLAAH